MSLWSTHHSFNNSGDDDDLLEFTENTLKLINNAKTTTILDLKESTQTSTPTTIKTTANTNTNTNTNTSTDKAQSKKVVKTTPNQILPDIEVSSAQKRVLFENENPDHITKVKRLSITSTTTLKITPSSSTHTTNETIQNTTEENEKHNRDDFSELLTLVQEEECSSTQIDDEKGEKLENENENKKSEENNIGFESKTEAKEEEEEGDEKTENEVKTSVKRQLPDWMLDPLIVQQKEENEARQYREKKDKFKEESTSPLYSLLFNDYQCEEIEDLPTGRVICFDVETTGFSADDCIIEMGAIEVIDGKRTGAIFQSYAQPRRAIHPMAYLAHQLSENMLLNTAPPLSFVVPNFLKFVGDSPLIAHNLHFDMRMLLLELERQNLSINPQHKLFCTMRFFRKKYPQRQYSLGALSIFFGIDQVIRRKTHGALVDSEILAQIYMQFLKLFPNSTHKNNPINDNHNNPHIDNNNNLNNNNNSNKHSETEKSDENTNNGDDENNNNNGIDQNNNNNNNNKNGDNENDVNEDKTLSPTQQATQLDLDEDESTIPM